MIDSSTHYYAVVVVVVLVVVSTAVSCFVCCRAKGLADENVRNFLWVLTPSYPYSTAAKALAANLNLAILFRPG